MFVAVAGALRAGVWRGGEEADCRLRLPEGSVEGVTGRLLGRAGEGAAPFRVDGGLDDGCRGEVRAFADRSLAPAQDALLRPGRRIRVGGSWRRQPGRAWTTPERAGYLVIEAVEPARERPFDFRGRVLRARGAAQERLVALFGERAPVAEALVLARKEHLDPELRDAFANAGVAHLLAISGFHVGIVAGLALVLARLAGAGPRRAPALAAGAAWAYVLAIGSPDAAVRASILLTLLAVGPLRGRPVVPLGALATAFLGFLLVDPGGLGRAGFQLSFAGTAGLILRARRWGEELREAARRRLPRALVSRGVVTGVAASLAATVATAPLVAWHFGRVPLMGIPATLLLGPLVALSIPGILLCLLLEPLAPGVAGFLAGGAGLFLEGAVRGALLLARVPGAAPWVSRPGLLCAMVAVALCGLALRGAGGAGSRRARRIAVAAAATAGLLLAPVAGAVARRGTVEVVAIDVGQGDAFAVRSPAGRWLLVDTGPRSATFDAGERRVVPYLRARGVHRLEAVVLTHPHLDHVGGAPAVLEAHEVGGVLDPGLAAAGASFEEALVAARGRGIGWWPAGSRPTLDLDGVELRVLYPPVGPVDVVGTDVANDVSVVVLLRYGRFRALLTGDAPAGVEEALLERIDGPVQLLKVGHHGSRSSTSSALLEALRPEVALVSAGWRNRYGHPHPEVLERLDGAAVRVFRTDLDGTVVVRARPDGSWEASLPDGR